jgi:hypothetical protein
MPILRKGRAVKFPKNINYYLVFLAVFAASLFWSKEIASSLEFFVLFFLGGIYYFLGYNLDKKVIKLIPKLILSLGILFGISYFYLVFSGNLTTKFGSLFFAHTFQHNHIGDYWALVLVILIPSLIKRKRLLLNSILALAGVYFLIISESRSAYLALLVAVFFLFYKKGWFEKYKKMVMVLAILIAGLFIYVGSIKTTIFSRPYFFQAFSGAIREPLGVGVGNFKEISFDKKNQILGMNQPSSYTHNIVFEIVAGLGILSLPFIYWLIKEVILCFKKDKNLINSAVFIALTVNFLFDLTYVIPAMLWLWFLLAGIIEKET